MLIEIHTGLTINYDKTVIYRLGSLANSNAKLYTSKSFQWTNEPFTLLGLEIANDGGVELNYESAINKMERILDAWAWHPLTLLGKVLVVNVLCESLFVYKLTVLPNIPMVQKNRILQLMKNFLWSGKRARISLDTLCVSKASGGLRLWDLNKKEQASKISCIWRLRQSPLFELCFFDHVDIPNWENMFQCNISKKRR